MKFAIFFVVTVLHSTTAFNFSAGDCAFLGTQDPQLHYIRPIFSQNSKFVYPNYESIYGYTTIKNGENVDITCYDGSIKDREQLYEEQKVQAKCEDGSFKIGEKLYDLNNFFCTKKPKDDVVSQLIDNKLIINIGFQNVPPNDFISQIKIEFDAQTLTTKSSQFTLTKSIAQSEKSVPAKKFKKDTFYPNIDIVTLYTRDEQRKNINALLGLDEGDPTYIKQTGEFYLVNGHLTAKADFVYASQQQATFHFVNAIPQWQVINNGNWKKVEEKVRDFADIAKKDLIVTTGTSGITKLPPTMGEDWVELYLYKNDKNEKKLPVPALVWKLIYDPVLKQGVHIISINNPYYIKGEDKICTDILPKLYWLKLEDPYNKEKGYIYACDYHEARAKIPELPDIHVTGLLL